MLKVFFARLVKLGKIIYYFIVFVPSMLHLCSGYVLTSAGAAKNDCVKAFMLFTLLHIVLICAYNNR